MWTSPSCPFGAIRTALKLRTNTTWTAAKAHQCSLPYHTAAGPWTSPTCPICQRTPSVPPAMDTQGHLFGSCLHPRMQGAYIARHNKAVLLIHRSIQAGPLGGCLAFVDASSSDRLPHGVLATRLPQWMLPSVDPALLTRLRPDILLIEGLTYPTYKSLLPTLHLPSTLRSLQHTCRLHLVEVGYTSDSRAATSHPKSSQHCQLAQLLLPAGWSLSTSPPPPFPNRMLLSQCIELSNLRRNWEEGQ